jgi:hypothetical protein
MADRSSLSNMRAQFMQERERTTYRIAQMLDYPPEYDPCRINPNMAGDRDLIIACKIDGSLLSITELVEVLTKIVVAQQSQIKALAEKVDSLTSKGSKKS